jgi:hypothetical protein
VDSNLLLVYCVGSVARSRVAEEKVTRHYGAADFRVLDEFFGHFDRILTTPNIMTEVSNLSRRLRADVWQLVLLWMKESFFDFVREEYVNSMAATKHLLFDELGISDATIGICADNGHLVVTDDLELSLRLEALNLPCVNYTRCLRPID